MVLCKTEKDKSLLLAFYVRTNKTVGSILSLTYSDKLHLPHRDARQPGLQKVELMCQTIANSLMSPLV